MSMDQKDAEAGVPIDAGAESLLDPSTQQRVKATRLGLSLDWWAVIIGLILAGLVLSGLLPPIKW